MIVILPETKGISLERMDKIFGEIDYVEAGEEQIDLKTGRNGSVADTEKGEESTKEGGQKN